MALKYAILGLLSWRPFSGYELRKFLSESVALYWSGNSNQVYPALVQLSKDGLVSSEVRQQGNYPPSKVYTVTPAGEEELLRWLTSEPSLPQLRNSFLTQLAWADRLNDSQLAQLVESYEHEVRMKLLMQRELIRRGIRGPARTPRETLLWSAIAEHDCALYEAELLWLHGLREGLQYGGAGGGATDGRATDGGGAS